MISTASILPWLSGAAGVVAALLWLYASTIVVKKGDPRSSEPSFFRGDVNVVSTASEQSRWNKYAAAMTAAAIILQALMASSVDEKIPGRWQMTAIPQIVGVPNAVWRFDTQTGALEFCAQNGRTICGPPNIPQSH